MRNIFVTGGTGTWGQEIVKQLLEKKGTKKVIVYSRAERSQEYMKRFVKDTRVEYILGDVCDYHRVKKSMKGCDTVFHTAAIKAVPNMEKDCMLGFNVNIEGTNNVVQSAVANKVKQFVFVSTDKGVDPINAYGVSKAAAEHIVKQAARDCPKTKFRIVRSGNVIGSSSSVLQVWKQALHDTNQIKVTVPEMTRFYITVHEAVEGLFKALEAKGVLHINLSKNASLETLARAAITLWGDSSSGVEIIGNRGNEKLHEQILSVYDGSPRDVYSCDTTEYTVDELVEIIKNEKI
jgi:UDP-N-acetylglucosamine 4,6-dehydratase/5-epimerase